MRNFSAFSLAISRRMSSFFSRSKFCLAILAASAMLPAAAAVTAQLYQVEGAVECGSLQVTEKLGRW
jgi:hypothetical protein